MPWDSHHISVKIPLQHMHIIRNVVLGLPSSPLKKPVDTRYKVKSTRIAACRLLGWTLHVSMNRQRNGPRRSETITGVHGWVPHESGPYGWSGGFAACGQTPTPMRAELMYLHHAQSTVISTYHGERHRPSTVDNQSLRVKSMILIMLTLLTSACKPPQSGCLERMCPYS